ncbi:MAG: glucokinase [Deltaproteobacteria bacterium]|nr:glucokinase [Deltaproteobacteria bacterium]
MNGEEAVAGILVGDIGGTKTTLAALSARRIPRDLLAIETFPSGEFASLEEIVARFLAGNDRVFDRAVFGIAGPARGGKVRTTNLPWIVEEDRLAKTFGFSSVRLINDLEAMAYGVPHLEPSELLVLNHGKPLEGGAMAVIAPGTGLGEAFLVWDGMRYRPHPSEGGHADFAPKTLLERELSVYLNETFGHVSYERVCSGPGISHIYDFLKENGYGDEPSWLSPQLADAGDAAPVITSAALDDARPCELCVKVLDEFVSILGAEAGNLALKVLAMGGVYLGGGIVPRILPFLRRAVFMRSFRDKGRYTDLMDRIPVYVILAPGVALLGAASAALEP